MSGESKPATQSVPQPAMVKVNNQSIYLTAEKKLNVRGTFGGNMLLYDSAGTVIPLDATGKTEFMLQEGSEYFVKPSATASSGASGAVAKPRPAIKSPTARSASALTPSKKAVPVVPAPVRAHPQNKVLLKAAARSATYPYARPAPPPVPSIRPATAPFSRPVAPLSLYRPVVRPAIVTAMPSAQHSPFRPSRATAPVRPPVPGLTAPSTSPALRRTNTAGAPPPPPYQPPRLPLPRMSAVTKAPVSLVASSPYPRRQAPVAAAGSIAGPVRNTPASTLARLRSAPPAYYPARLSPRVTPAAAAPRVVAAPATLVARGRPYPPPAFRGLSTVRPYVRPAGGYFPGNASIGRR